MPSYTTNIFSAAKNAITRFFISAASQVGYAPKYDNPKLIVNKVDVRPIVRQVQDVNKWRTALIQAESIGQQRAMLYDLYEDIMLDAHLSAVMQKRIAKVTNTELEFCIDGKPVDEINKITKRSYFEEFIKEALNAKFYGHSLLEMDWKTGDTEAESKTILINRKHVKPRFGIVTKNQFDTKGIPYREKPFNKTVIEIGKPEDLGLILKACPYAIFKRGNFGDWAQYSEIFGMPFRWATYQNEQSRAVLEEALEKAGSAGFVVAPADANLQFLSHASSTGTDIFQKLKDACNDEMSILMLGNSMTTSQATTSGFAQGKVHADEQDDLHQDDRMYLLRCLMEKLTPYLASIGYQTEGGEWRYVEKDGLTLKDRLNIAVTVNGITPIDENYWYETFNLPKPANLEALKKERAANDAAAKEKGDAKKKKS